MAEIDPAPEIKSALPADYDPAPLIHLATAIVERRAIVYVGAGASVPSGAPLWSDLLTWLYEEGAKPLLKKDPESSDYLKSRLDKEKAFLEAADLLQDILDNDLPRLLREKFAGVCSPSSIHLNIGRIPFTTAITTNYDDLLEKASSRCTSGQHAPYLLTWNRPAAILKAIQENAPFVLKTHGTVDDPDSLILSSRQYRDLIHANPLYWQILKWIFMTKMCLFVGCSLTDADLLQLFEEAMTEIGRGNFGPHYALLPANEAPSIKIDNLLHQLNIRVILLENPKKSAKETKNEKDVSSGQKNKRDSTNQIEDDAGRRSAGKKKEDQDNDDMKWVEAAASQVLVSLAGEVAKQTVATQPPPLPTSDDQDFFLKQALKELLQTAVEVTGSFRGDIILNDRLEKRLWAGPQDEETPKSADATRIEKRLREESAELHVRVSCPTNPGLENQAIDRQSVCGIAYYEATPGIGVNIRDVKHPDLNQDSDVWHWGKINYIPAHTEVQSELAMPILADGVRVGVLNLESCLEGAYSAGHVTAAHWYSEKAGRLFGTATTRNRRARSLHPEVTSKIQNFFLDLLRKLWVLRTWDPFDSPHQRDEVALDFLVFYADYIHGTLEAPIPEPASSRFKKATFTFDEKPVFTGEVFRNRSGIFCPNAEQAIKDKLISNKYADGLELTGPLIGFPIYIQGYTAGVFAGWYRAGKGGELDWRDMERFQRASHLIANATGGKHSRLQPVQELIQPKEGKASQNEAEGRGADDKRRIHFAEQHVAGAAETVEFCLLNPVVPEPTGKNEHEFQRILYTPWKDIARKIASLLAMLWIRYGDYKEHWMVPSRARLWVVSKKRKIKTGNGREDNPALPPLFGLVAEISLDIESLETAWKKFRDASPPVGDESAYGKLWTECAQDVKAKIRNLPKDLIRGKEEPIFVISMPEVSDDEIAASAKKTAREEVSVNDFIPSNKLIPEEAASNIPCWIVPDDDFSFLLSRLWADPFTRFQKPGPKGDPLAGMKGAQDAYQSRIYAAPIMLVRDPKQIQLHRHNEDEDEESPLLVVEKKLTRTQLREPVGILSLDSPDLWTLPSNVLEPPLPTEESHIALRRELLHTIDLFTACLAETAEFRNIGTYDEHS